MTLQTPPGNIDSQNRLPPPLRAYNVNGSKTSSSQNGYPPDWSLGHLGLSEGKSNEVWMEQRRRLTEMVCWPDVSPTDLQPSESSSHADSPYRFIPPFLAPGFVPCSTQYTVVEMNFVSLPLEHQYSVRKSDNHWWIARSTPSLAPGQSCLLKCTDDLYVPVFFGRNPSCYILSKKNGSLLCPPVENVCSLADVLILYISKGRSWEAWVLAMILNIIKFKYAYGK